MFEFFIPEAMAQGITGTATNAASAGRDVAVGGATSGVQTLISYFVNNIGNWIAALVIIVISWIVASMAAKGAKNAIMKERDDVQESALILVERMVKMLVITVGVTIALAINGLNFTAVIGALSLGIGFALKDIIGNFISGVIMLAQNRINIGDFIKVQDTLGTIVNIDTRATILQAIDGTEVVIPNQIMLGETLISYTTNPFRRIDLAVGVDYKTNLPMVTSLIKAIIDKDENIVVKPEPLILVDEFGDSSINILIRFWVESTASWLTIRSNLANHIKQAFDEVGVNIPFPIRTLKLDEDDRSFLKTMDSMKKGLVPEKATVPSDSQVAKAAGNTEMATQIPYNIFEENQRTGQVVTPEEMKPSAAHTDTKETIEPKPKPTPAPAAPTAPAATSTAPENPSKPAPNTEVEAPKQQPIVTPPPTHL